MKPPVKLSRHDIDLLWELKHERTLHIDRRDHYKELANVENLRAKSLGNRALAEKFDVTETTIRRIFSNGV